MNLTVFKMNHISTLGGLGMKGDDRSYLSYTGKTLYTLVKKAKRIAQKHDTLIGKFVSHKGMA